MSVRSVKPATGTQASGSKRADGWSGCAVGGTAQDTRPRGPRRAGTRHDPASLNVNPCLESPVAAHAPIRSAAARTWALSGTALIAAGGVSVLALHVVALEEVDPVRRTLSQYALGRWKPVFDAGVLAVAFGSVAVLAALVRTNLARWRGAAAG